MELGGQYGRGQAGAGARSLSIHSAYGAGTLPGLRLSPRGPVAGSVEAAALSVVASTATPTRRAKSTPRAALAPVRALLGIGRPPVLVGEQSTIFASVNKIFGWRLRGDVV